jgi:hypothetical protein
VQLSPADVMGRARGVDRNRPSAGSAAPARRSLSSQRTRFRDPDMRRDGPPKRKPRNLKDRDWLWHAEKPAAGPFGRQRR